MKLEPDELEALAASLAPLVAAKLAERLEESPQWAMSVPEAAAWAKLEEHCIRGDIDSRRLPCVRVGRQVRIRRSDLFSIRTKEA